MVHDAPVIERLDIPKYNWWNECLHSVGRAGMATVFPQSIGLAATWNTGLMRRVAVAISDRAPTGAEMARKCHQRLSTARKQPSEQLPKLEIRSAAADSRVRQG